MSMTDERKDILTSIEESKMYGVKQCSSRKTEDYKLYVDRIKQIDRNIWYTSLDKEEKNELRLKLCKSAVEVSHHFPSALNTVVSSLMPTFKDLPEAKALLYNVVKSIQESQIRKAEKQYELREEMKESDSRQKKWLLFAIIGPIIVLILWKIFNK